MEDRRRQSLAYALGGCGGRGRVQRLRKLVRLIPRQVLIDLLDERRLVMRCG